MSDFALRMNKLRYLHEHHSMHDLTNDCVMHAYYRVMLWTYGRAIIAGNYQ